MTDPRILAGDAPTSGEAAISPAAVSADAPGDASLLALVERLAGLLERSDLTELEVEAGGTGLILRKAAALPTYAAAVDAGHAGDPGAGNPGHFADTTARRERGGTGMPGGPFSQPGPAALSGSSSGAVAAPGATSERGAGAVGPTAVRAPLTGIFYSAPGPGSPPFVEVGREVVVGQVIGLIEAMKLFNEIKSDQGGRVVRVNVEDGALVKAKQPLLEVEPL